MDEKMKRFAALMESDSITDLIRRRLDCQGNLEGARVFIRPGKKYTKIDRGGSGYYMVDNATGEIYGIKAYGVVNRRQLFGTLDTIYNWFWGGYRGQKCQTRENVKLRSVDAEMALRGYTPKAKETQKPEKVFTADRYKDLLTDLTAAAQAGKEAAALVDDGGTCNMDSTIVELPRFIEEKTEKAISAAGLFGFKHRDRWIISPPSVGQADKRCAAAEAMAKALQAKGYAASIWYQMD